MAGIYIHIPFCRALCSYCNFYFSLSEQRKEQMYRAILQEIDSSDRFLPINDRVTTLYIGGGTPSLFTVDMLVSLIDKVKEKFDVESFEEVTIETNPDDLTDEYLFKLSQSECSRLSIGIQSFDDNILKFLNRRHTADEAYRVVESVKKYGFNNFTLDLIYGIPNQSLEMLQKDIDSLLSLSPTHISAYHLTIEERSILWKRLLRGEIKAVEDSVSEEHFALVSKGLKSAGFEHYEVSNFAKKGYRAIHNANYWKSMPYMGFGPSAHSFNGDNIRRWNCASNLKYLRGVECGEKYFESEILSVKDRVNEELMTFLRTSDGVDLNYLEEKYRVSVAAEILKSSERFILSNQLICNGKHLKIESENFLRSDYIISSLFL